MWLSKHFIINIIFYLICVNNGVLCDSGEHDPVFVTPMLENGNFKEAQKLAKVTPDIGNITSYSGYFTIDKECESNLFFWFMPSQKGNWKQKPVLFWQQGGPGTSSLFGLFEELGPFQHLNKTGLQKIKYSWNLENNLLIIDNPAGVGFSFSGKKCYPENGTAVADGLYLALVQFYKLFPEVKSNPLILSGESYAGHYLPSLGHAIHKNNPSAQVKINLTSFLIGGSWTDPLSQIDYGTYYYQLGLIDDKTKDIYYEFQKNCTDSINDGDDWDWAFYYCDSLTANLYDWNVGTKVNIYNLLPGSDKKSQNWEEFIQSPETRSALHVGNHSYQTYSDVIFNNLRLEKYQSVKPYVEELIEHYPMVFMNGQLDLIVPYVSASKFLHNTSWSGKEDYVNMNRTFWCLDDDLVGYYKGDHLYDIMVRGAGHYIPKDKPKVAYQILKSVTTATSSDLLHLLEKCETP